MPMGAANFVGNTVGLTCVPDCAVLEARFGMAASLDRVACKVLSPHSHGNAFEQFRNAR